MITIILMTPVALGGVILVGPVDSAGSPATALTMVVEEKAAEEREGSIPMTRTMKWTGRRMSL